MATTTLTPAASTYRSGLYDWITTTDHKKIGILYVINSFLFFFLGRPAGARRPVRAGPAGPPVRDRPDLQRAVLDARDGDDLPVHHPDPRRLRELHRPAPDRRAGHGVPAHQRAVVLDAAAGRDPALLGLRHRRDRGGRLDELQPAGPGPAARRGRVRAGPVDRRARAHRHELDPGRHQLPRHDLQDARAGHDPVPDADHGLDRARDVGPRADGHAGHHERPDHAVHRPQLRRGVLRPARRRRRDPLPERLLVLLASGGLRHDPARDGHDQRDPAGLQPQAALRLQGVHLRDGRRSGPSASRCGRTTCSRPARCTCRSSAS